MMKILNSFRSVIMASVIMPIVLVNIVTIAGIDKLKYANKKRNQLFVGWTALAGVSFVAKKVLEKPSYGSLADRWVTVRSSQRLAKACGRVGLMASIPALTAFGCILTSIMVVSPAMHLAEKKYGSS